MAYEAKYPILPPLYKVLENGKSCNTGSYTWKTDGSINYLPREQRGLPLKHCKVGFHLTTDWREWYEFGRDVYTAEIVDGEVLVRYDGWNEECEDKVVAAAVSLREKNGDPLARLLKDFYLDVVEVAKNFQRLRDRGGDKLPNRCKHYGNSYADEFVTYEHLSFPVDAPLLNKTDKGYNAEDSAFDNCVAYVVGLLVKSVDEGISEKERNRVRKIWELWKAGWVVHGKENGRYVVS